MGIDTILVIMIRLARVGAPQARGHSASWGYFGRRNFR
jgi:hypothetical protein